MRQLINVNPSENSTFLKFLSVALFVAGASFAAAQNEIPVQGRSALGGSANEIRGTVNGKTGWSLTGVSSDVAKVFDSTGYKVAEVAIEDFVLGWNGGVFVTDIVRLSDGQTRIFAETPNTPSIFHGGWVELRRRSPNGPLADKDSIVLNGMP